MKKYLLTITILGSLHLTQAQTKAGSIQKKITDSMCSCISKLDMSKITTKAQAESAFTDCFATHAMLSLVELAEEKKMDISDEAEMEKLGMEIGKDLLKTNCTGFVKLSMAMAKEQDADAVNYTTGSLKRIDTKEFNYFILTDEDKKEQSFIWLRQFPGSEVFIDGATTMLGKRFKISWKEIEVYLPKAKGYYKVKEIVAVNSLQ